jgi:hypothetical protein
MYVFILPKCGTIEINSQAQEMWRDRRRFPNPKNVERSTKISKTPEWGPMWRINSFATNAERLPIFASYRDINHFFPISPFGKRGALNPIVPIWGNGVPMAPRLNNRANEVDYAIYCHAW